MKLGKIQLRFLRASAAAFSSLLKLAVSCFLLVVLVFFLAHLAPGDPLTSYYGDRVQRMSTEQKAQAMENLGLDRPLPEQLISWLERAAAGDFGISYKYKRPVSQIVSAYFLNTLLLGGISFVLTFSLAILLGVKCARREDSLFDRILCKLGTIITCIPSFWIAIVFILLFSVYLRILPSGGLYAVGRDTPAQRAYHLVLPVSVMVIGHLWYYGYIVRNKMCEEQRQDYVTTAKAKGLPERLIIRRHCLKNIMPALVTVMAQSLIHILTGTYVVEMVFSYPGLGLLIFESAQYHDYNMLMVLCMLTGIVVISVNAGGRVLCTWLDPRTRKAGSP